MQGKGIESVRDKRTTSCKSSSSSSIARRTLCDCGEEVALLKSKSTKNPGRMFWRCPNWNADGGVCELQQPKFEECRVYEDEIEELKRKVTKLRKKLTDERVKVKAALACIILLLVIAVGLSVFAVLNFEGMKGTV
ncbi:hypothetical protein SESBI_32570 [Sesbania bispinosa]|nr:hypothetical protein SESBI_32570 [Sesbania bispinosa]